MDTSIFSVMSFTYWTGSNLRTHPYLLLCHSLTRDAQTYGHMHIFCLVIHLIEMQKLMETSIFPVVSFTYLRCTNLRTHLYFLLCHSIIGEAQTYEHIHIFCCVINLLEMQKLMETSIFSVLSFTF